MFEEQRSEPRETLALHVKVAGGADAVTRDISPSGMYIEIRGDHELDGTLLFEMHVDEPRMKFTAEGRIVRIEHRDGFTGIAVRLLSPRLHMLD